MKQSFSFSKSERLTSKKEIDALFLTGKAFFIYPFKLVFQVKKVTTLENQPLKVVMSVPKRNFKRANKRNHLRRLMKESYRLHKHTIKEKLNEQHAIMHLMIVYSIKEELNYQEILPKMVKSLQALGEAIQPNTL